jgi:hypothetical protein
VHSALLPQTNGGLTSGKPALARGLGKLAAQIDQINSACSIARRQSNGMSVRYWGLKRLVA